MITFAYNGCTLWINRILDKNHADGLLHSARTCNDVDVGVEVLAEADGGAVPLEPIPELLLDGSGATQSVQSNHLPQNTTITPVLVETHAAAGCDQQRCTLSPRRSISATHFWMSRGIGTPEPSFSTSWCSSSPNTLAGSEAS